MDHAIQTAREKGADLIRRRVAALNAQLPIVLVGDFNAVALDNPAYDVLVKDGFQDTWPMAAERRNAEFNSFNGFETPEKAGQRIDWILVRGSADVRATEIVTFQKGNQFPSDHFPVVSWMTLK